MTHLDRPHRGAPSWYRLIVVLVALLVGGMGGCASQHDTLVSQGYPAAYADGFEDGCHSGKKAAGSYFDQFRKDVGRFNAEHDYAQGWSDAYRQCESEQEAVDRQIRTAQTLNAIHEQHDRDFARRVLKGVDTSGLKDLKL